MIGKNNQYLKKTKEGTKIETYSIKKFKVGTASVVIGASIFFGAGAVVQAGEEVSKNTTTDNSKNEDATLGGAVSEKVVAKPVVKEATKEEVAAGVAAKLGVKETGKEAEKESVKALDKTQLSSFISEIEGKISSGAYANKTEESVANLVVDLSAAKTTLASATTQEELTKAYQKLVVSVNSKLRNKPIEKKETPVVDSTTLKETVDNKAENAEKKVEANSIENLGAQDIRNGKEIAKNTAFRAAVNQDPKVDFAFSIPSEKKIYIYNEEHFSLEIPVYSETGKIRYATIKKGSRQRFSNVAGTDNDLDVEFGFTATVINRAETPGVTSDASQANPAKIVITGRPNDILKKHRDYTKQETQTLNIGTRYIQVVDDQGRENLKKGDSFSDPGYFYLVLKAQSKKYALRSQPTDEKISVSSLTNPTAEDLQKIKDSIQLEYSTTNEDARLADKRGTLVEHPEDVIQSVNIVGNNIVVTFTDGSTKTKPVGEIVQKNIPPVVSLPYSNEANRNIYIYSGEETDLTFTATDESKIKDLKLRGPGDINYNNVSSFGLAVGNIADSTVTSGEGSVSEDKKTATIKMTGTTNLRDGQKWTSVIVAKDDNNGESAPFNGRINATTNPAERQKTAGYVEFVVKNQTKKYDIKAPEGKVSVVDPTNVTAEEFEKIKEKVKIEYSQTNDDANLTSKRGQAVDNQATRISTITKDASGNLVVTYKDGSTDTKPLSEYVSLNKQPAIDAINTAADNKIAEINSNTNATAEEKATAIQKVNADKAKALTAINDNSVTTKSALDNAKTSGTTAISNDNPVVTKKDTAKAAIDTALREKEAAIDANNALTTEEKNTAKADAQAKATAAKTAIDNATTNAAVDSAKTAGTTSVSSVTPTATAKPAAKKAIDDALKAKNDEIAARTDLTDEEKAKAKEDVKAKADAAKQAIDKATTNSEVDQAKTAGTAEVKAVDPQPVAKAEAKKAIDETLKAKNDEIDARTDLTDEEKTAAKANAKAIADGAKEAIDKAVTNAEVEQAKTYGTSEVTSVNPEAVVKTEAKKAVDEALKAKNDEIDARTDLTDEEKIAAKAEAKEKADEVKQAIDKATTNAEVAQAKTNGTTEVKAVDPQPVAKTEAKKAIDDALKTKNDEIDARTDLTDEEKTAAKAYAQAKANAAKEAIDKATTNAEVEQAKTNGTLDVTSVDPQPVAKPEAKKAIDEVLKAKNDEIDARRDLTDEEKVKAKEEAKEKADAAKKAIDRATTDEEVEQMEINGTTEVKAVDPQPVAKTAAKQAIDEVLKAKNDEIDARRDLTDEEKIAAKAEAKAKADAAKEGIDIATTNAEIDQIKKNGTTEVTSVNPEAVAKTEAKEVIDETLKSKNDEIDARTDLTDEEKTAAKEEAKAKADAAKEAIDKATTNAEVTQAKANGTKEVASVDPEALVKSVAKKAIEDKLAEQLKVIANTPDATDEEKKAAADLAKQLAEVAKKAIDAARENADVKKLQDNSKVGIEEAVPFVEDKPNTRKAIDAEAKVKKAAIDARTDISDKVKELLKAEVDEIAAQAKKAIDAASSVDEINKIEEAKKLEIKAVEEVRVPAEKVIVADPTNLTDEEKAKVLAAIKSVNPDVKEITQDAKGNVIVITANGHKQVISVAQVTKTEADLVKENAGNVVNAPAAKTVVADVTKLTEAKKQEIVAKVKAVNPGATVAIDEKGNIIVTNGEGLVFVLPVLDLVIPTDKLTDITANSKVNTPAIRTLVANKGSLTPEEIAKIKAAIEEINPGAIVVVDAKGNATVTTKDGKSMTISSDVLVKDAADVAVKNNGENINLDFDKEVVADINNLTESDKEKVKFKVLGAIREAVELVVDAKGNVTVILKDGRTFTILAKDIFEQRKEVTVNLPEKIKVKDASNLTETEKEAIKQALITANSNLKDAKITISSTGEATIVYPDGQVIVISAKNLVVTEKTTGVIVEDNAGNYTKEDKKPTVDYSNDNTPKFSAKKGQRLANTGEAETNTGLAGLGMALLGGLLAVAKRRKEKEE